MASPSLIEKLRPANYTAMSGQFAAIVGYILGQRSTDPSISEMFVTLDGGVLIRHTGDPGANEFYGPLAMLQENWSKLLDVADLTPTERLEAMALFEAQIGKEGAVAKREPPHPPPSGPPLGYGPPTSKN